MVLLSCSTTKGQPSWKLIGKIPEGNTYMYTELVKKESNTLYVWFKQEYKVWINDEIVYPDASKKSLMVINCADKKVLTNEFTFYNSYGKVIFSSEGSKSWQYVTPESIGEAMLKSACAYFNE